MNKGKQIRPPYAADLSRFGQTCPECEGMCSNACEENIIIIGKDRTPHLDFSKGGCTYCGACLEACSPGVLSHTEEPIHAAVRINPLKCVSWQGVMCFSCKEPCLDNAIDFKGLYKPDINASRCTSCGFCIGRCPSEAIETTFFKGNE
uniref:ferredoxin-type protein NapF n=1 Tax=Thiomicrolovo subterrani TaxID=3131934 RepID=UPI003F634573